MPTDRISKIDSLTDKMEHDAIWDWNINDGTIAYGEVIDSLLGYAPKEMKSNSSSLFDFIHPEDTERVERSVREALADADIFHWTQQYRYLKKDQTYAYIIDKAYIVRRPDGTAERMVGSMRDISDKKHLEDLLEKSNRMARIGSWEIDVQSGLIFWSDITKDIHEVSHEVQMITLDEGRKYYKEGSNRDLIIEKMKLLRSTGNPFDLELEIETAKGNEKWVRVMAEAEFVSGICTKIYGNIQDISERKIHEIELKDALDENINILESIGDAFIATDRNWIVTYWNSMAEKMIGVNREEVIGKNIWDVFVSSIGSTSYTNYKEAMELQAPRFFEDMYGGRWYESKAFPSSKGLAIYFHDISERKNAEIELKNLNQNLQLQTKDLEAVNTELEQFAYIASHDLKEPLRMVKAFLSLIDTKYAPLLDEKGKKYIRFAVEGAERMESLINDLLKYTLTTTHDETEFVDLNQIIEEVTNLLVKNIHDSKAIIKKEKLPIVKINRVAIMQVFLNLISNALKYQTLNNQPFIQISFSESANNWILCVKDNGIGISKSYLQKIFIIFNRLHSKSQYTGTGIGLAICKKIVEKNGGSIWVESEENVGSSFYFTIVK